MSSQQLFDKVSDIASRQASGIQRENLFVEAGQMPLVLADQLRFEGTISIARNVRSDAYRKSDQARGTHRSGPCYSCVDERERSARHDQTYSYSSNLSAESSLFRKLNA
jgi:hypothetical protein